VKTAKAEDRRPKTAKAEDRDGDEGKDREDRVKTV
jgi:hypothetical protein